jgi:hypothetical protein
MFSLLIYSRTAWEDYYPSTNKTTLSSQTYTSRQNPSGAGVYVLDCLFRDITYPYGGGGALRCYGSVPYFLVESTTFLSCKTGGGYLGGAIFFSNSDNGQSVLHKVCGYDCCAGGSFQFAFISVSKSASCKNYVNYSSTVRCVKSDADSTLRLGSGKICCSSVNSSLNKCYQYSGIDCLNSVICSLAYSSFADNDADKSVCLLIDTGAKCEIKSCNILRNTQSSLSSKGTICTYGNLNIEHSCILENTADYIFYQYSSYYYSTTVTLSYCTVDKTTNNGNLTIQSTVTKSFILELNHMSTQSCHSEYDSFGNITAITPPTPAPTGTLAPTPEETPAPTHEETPAQTFEKTHAPTLEKTPAPTLVLDDDANAESDSLSGGAIAGIVITCIIVVAAIAGIVIFIVIRKRSMNADDFDLSQERI